MCTLGLTLQIYKSCRADLANLVNEAALLAGRQNKVVVEKIDFIQAVERAIAVSLSHFLPPPSCTYVSVNVPLVSFCIFFSFACFMCLLIANIQLSVKKTEQSETNYLFYRA